MLALSVEAHRTGCAVVVATGELDLAGARRVLDRMDRLVSEGRDRIVLDMSGVAFCGAQAMSALVRTRARAQRAGGWLRLAAVPPHVRRVFERTDLDRLFPRYPDVASAATGRAVEARAAGDAARAVSGDTVSGGLVAGGGAVSGGNGGRARRAAVGGRRVSRGGPAAAGDGAGPDVTPTPGPVTPGSVTPGSGGASDGPVSPGDRGVVEREPPSHAR